MLTKEGQSEGKNLKILGVILAFRIIESLHFLLFI